MTKLILFTTVTGIFFLSLLSDHPFFQQLLACFFCLLIFIFVLYSRWQKGSHLRLEFDINDSIAFRFKKDENFRNEANKILAKSAYGQISNNIWILNKYPYLAIGCTYYSFVMQNNTTTKAQKNLAVEMFAEAGCPGETLFSDREQIRNEFVFESFLQVCQCLPLAVITLRTFGEDGQWLEENLSRNDASWMYCQHFSALRQKDDTVLFSNFKVQRNKEEFTCFLETLSPGNRLIVKDDFESWTSSRKNENGKFICADAFRTVFAFDDRSDSMQLAETINRNDPYFFRVNPFLAATDKNYYLKIIKMHQKPFFHVLWNMRKIFSL